MNVSQSIQTSFSKSLSAVKTRKDVFSILVFISALVAFEAFNFSTTDFALSDLLGDLRFGGVRWALLLSIAFCGIDFAGILRLFSPQTNQQEARSAWFMFGAWFLAATMNAILTWWGVVMAMQTHPVLSAGVVDATFVTKVVPIFIALMVWVIRVLLVGTLSKKSDHLLNKPSKPAQPVMSRREFRQAQSRSAHPAQAKPSVSVNFSGSLQSRKGSKKQSYRPDPKYIPMEASEMPYHSFKSNQSGQRRA